MRKLPISEVTPNLLQSYEDWMLRNSKSVSTIGIYIRNVRTVLNEAIEEGLLPKSAYPFGKKKYQIPSSRNVKKALPLSSVRDIVNYPVQNPSEERARDLWVLTYLCNGINVKDIAKLRNKNMNQDTLVFVRSKSERSTKQDSKPIVVMLIPKIKEIIEKWGNKSELPNDFVFEVLDGTETPKVQLSRIKQQTKTINKYMKRIGIKLGIETRLTTYVARHTFATVLKRSGAPIELISESLGHNNLKTTEYYLDSFDFAMKENFQKMLLDFK